MKSTITSLTTVLVLTSLWTMAHSFGIPADTLHGLQTAASALVHSTTTAAQVPHVPSFFTPSSSSSVAFPQDLLHLYKHALAQHPLITKMATGATLAVAGDAIAQSQQRQKQAQQQQQQYSEKDKFDSQDESTATNTASTAVAAPVAEYDVRRAASFALFDMSYRALQHHAFPVIVQHCKGQYLSAALSLPIMMIDSISSTTTTTAVLSVDNTAMAAAMEQTLASQLGIVPFLYYPAFFTVTGAIQGLTWSEGCSRAKDNFLPLMKRNLLFWIPVQFVQFGYVPSEWQIPFLSACGLLWTCILSLMAGSTKSYQQQQPQYSVEENPATAISVSPPEPLMATTAPPDLMAVVAVGATNDQEQSSPNSVLASKSSSVDESSPALKRSYANVRV